MLFSQSGRTGHNQCSLFFITIATILLFAITLWLA